VADTLRLPPSNCTLLGHHNWNKIKHQPLRKILGRCESRQHISKQLKRIEAFA
jgi:hypothetical protein